MRHFTLSQRDQLQALVRAGHTQREMADIVGCSQPTVSRELMRNGSPLQGRYTASTAQAKAEDRRTHAYDDLPRWHDDPELLGHVLAELRCGRTPDQISGRRKMEGLTHVSCQTLYSYVERDRENGGSLHKCLRYQGEKYKWIGFGKGVNRIPGRKGIEERPGAVDRKERCGDWETDLVVSSRKGSGAVATFAERLSMYFQAIKVESPSADEMVRASRDALGKLPEGMRKTMTHDNGKEICKHGEITEALGIAVYCARPYRSCDRGLNEWMNRELRRFFPKGTDFSQVTQKEIDYAVDWLNNCPRRTLKYRTPREVFEEQLEIMRFTL
ncbi:MAG: IS30 family transposase [Patescibacteria group bacterium]